MGSPRKLRFVKSTCLRCFSWGWVAHGHEAVRHNIPQHTWTSVLSAQGLEFETWEGDTAGVVPTQGYTGTVQGQAWRWRGGFDAILMLRVSTEPGLGRRAWVQNEVQGQCLESQNVWWLLYIPRVHKTISRSSWQAPRPDLSCKSSSQWNADTTAKVTLGDWEA